MRKTLLFSIALVPVAAGLLSLPSCQQTATLAPLRTFERAQKMDVVCLKIRDNQGNIIPGPPTPVPLTDCQPPTPATNGTSLPNHLYALVTQSVRGEIAVVDLTQGFVVDQSSSDPGINFHTVGQLPVDITVAPDGAHAFVSTADPFKPAIYALPTARILGDSLGQAPPSKLTTWPVCLLPQKGGPITAIARSDGYDLAVVLPGDAATSAKVVLIDGKTITSSPPGALVPCSIRQSIELSSTVPGAFSAGDPWPDGVPYADASAQLPAPAAQAACTDVPPSTILDGGVVDASGDAAVYAIRPLRGSRPHASWAVHDGDFLFVADDGLPLIHVFDVSKPDAITELEPYVATSLENPTRVVSVGQIAISPATHDFKRYMYAIDVHDAARTSGGGGTIMVFDVTDPRTGSHVPLRRPHPELNPFQPLDRISFSSPVASVAFARHDFPLTTLGGSTLQAARTGLLCNPHQDIDPATLPPSADDVQAGAAYRGVATSSTQAWQALGPGRLRGIFGLVTLASGQVVTIDVDDWDAPCRRPQNLNGKCPNSPMPDSCRPGALMLPEPVDDSSPWGAPEFPSANPTAANAIGTSGEQFFPVSAPHRTRSLVLLSNSTTTGQNLPQTIGMPQLLLTNQPIADQQARAAGYPNISLSLMLDEPQVHTDQDWTFTYEGALPGFNGLAANIETTDGYLTLSFVSDSGRFCARGVEDFELGKRRVAAALKENASLVGSRQLERTADYVQITDDLLPGGDPYWTLPNDQLSCWNDLQDNTGKLRSLTSPADRYNTCAQMFGSASSPTLARELPILSASDDRLIAGRFLYQGAPPGQTNTPSPQNRVVGPLDPSSATMMKLVECCFHRQVHFNVRTGGEWVAVGSVTGYLHHVKAMPGSKACVLSCDPQSVLMNARAIEAIAPAMAKTPVIDPNSAFAMRNPSLYAAFLGGPPPNVGAPNQLVFTNTPRDLTYKVTARGHFSPQTIALSSSTVAVSPQSMRYIEPLGQMAIIDGSSLGLVLVDLNTLVVAKQYF